MDLTRRGLIGRALAGGGALLLRPRVAFAGSAGESVFDMHLPAGARASAAGAWTSAAMRAPKRFELLGIEWGDGPDPDIQVRARTAAGHWSQWLDAPLGHGHGPDDQRRARRLTDPVWTGPAELFQLRASRSLAGARVVFVDAGAPAPAHASSTPYVDSGLAAGPGQPKIVARSSWATAACKPRQTAGLGAVELAFVHHTVSSNYYSAGQSGGLVRSICLFHKYGNGWNDIGYNFVVDRFGQIFEAREGGIDEPIVGAQAGGYNVYSSGVALLGSFGSRGPSRQAFNALARLVAWKLALHGVAVPGNVTVQVTSAGAPYSRYRAGTRVRLDRISGHRDGDATTCPGNALYRQLPRLRQVVHGLAPSVTSLTARPLPAGPGAASVTGGLSAGGLPIAGAGVELQQRTAGGLKTIGLATTAPDGTWAAAAALAANASLRAVFRGDPAHSAVVSAPVNVTVAPQVSLTAGTQQTPPGGVIEFTGAVTPAKTAVTIVISQQQPDGSFAPVRTIKFKPARDGTFTRTIGFPAPGQYQVVAQTAADKSNGAGASVPVAITAA